jgi:two-component system chemotaxis response regulator CheY
MAKILIIDDSAVHIAIIKKFLLKAGHEVIGQSYSGTETIKLYKKTKPDIVLLDIVLFDSNGITILDQLIKFDKNANVIMCSSTSLRNVISDSIQLGAKGFLIKPVKKDVLIKTINRVIELEKI